MEDRRIRHGIFYGIIIVAAIGVLAVFVLNLNTTDTALTASDSASTTPLSDNTASTAQPVAQASSSISSLLPPASAGRLIVSGPMTFELSTTTTQQEQGLSDRPIVPDDYAMVFVFPADDYYGFWMKDMDVPLDIVWLSDTGIVVGIEASLATSTYPNAVYPPQKVKYVLETKAGFMSEHGVGVGDPFPDLPPLSTITQ